MHVLLFKSFAVLLGLLLLLPAASSEVKAQAYKEEYRLSSNMYRPYSWADGVDRWIELINEKSNGRIKIKVYPGMSLVGGQQTREFTAIRQGVIDLSVTAVQNWAPHVKELNLFSLPFFFEDYAAIDRVTNSEVGEQLFKLVAEKGVIPLAWGENGFREISNSKRVIRTPEDLHGLKIRVVGSPIPVDVMTALKANPTQMSWSDLQPALGTGAVDGQENPVPIFTVGKLQNLNQKHITIWHYIADPLIFSVSEVSWNGWSEEDRKIVREAAVEAAQRQVASARKGMLDGAVYKDMEAAGVTVTVLTPEQKKPFRDAARPAYEKWANVIGEDLVKKAEKISAGK
jgi:TRAP-type transport system periplasmic protein